MDQPSYGNAFERAVIAAAAICHRSWSSSQNSISDNTVGRHDATKAQIDDHLRNKFPPKQTSLQWLGFLCWINTVIDCIFNIHFRCFVAAFGAPLVKNRRVPNQLSNGLHVDLTNGVHCIHHHVSKINRRCQDQDKFVRWLLCSWQAYKLVSSHIFIFEVVVRQQQTSAWLSFETI